VAVRPSAPALINSIQQVLGTRGDTAYNFTLSAHNPGKHGAVTVTVKVMVDGKPEEGSFSQTIPPGAYATVAGLLKCDGMTAGLHHAELRVSATGGRASVQTSTLIVQSAEAAAAP
jgi:hypothetical protein